MCNPTEVVIGFIVVDLGLSLRGNVSPGAYCPSRRMSPGIVSLGRVV